MLNLSVHQHQCMMWGASNKSVVSTVFMFGAHTTPEQSLPQKLHLCVCVCVCVCGRAPHATSGVFWGASNFCVACCRWHTATQKHHHKFYFRSTHNAADDYWETKDTKACDRTPRKLLFPCLCLMFYTSTKGVLKNDKKGQSVTVEILSRRSSYVFADDLVYWMFCYTVHMGISCSREHSSCVFSYYVHMRRSFHTEDMSCPEATGQRQVVYSLEGSPEPQSRSHVSCKANHKDLACNSCHIGKFTIRADFTLVAPAYTSPSKWAKSVPPSHNSPHPTNLCEEHFKIPVRW